MMKADKNNNVAPDSNFSTGAKALFAIIVGAVGISLLVSAIPIIIPMLWVSLIIVSGFATLWGVIELLGFGINTVKKCKKNKGGK